MLFNLAELSAVDKQYYLQHVVVPRPICLASTIDKNGNSNLSPFSFFNIFSTHPPVVIFSPSRRIRNNTIKHTLENVLEVPEVVINIVDFSMVQQTSLSSFEYPKAIDEFAKAGFTKEAASLVKPFMVKESKAKLECKVLEVKSLGNEGGAGQLIICEVLVLHVCDSLLNDKQQFEQAELDVVARLGGDWYCRVTKDNMFTVAKPNTKMSIGMDLLPANIRNSNILTGNHLAQLASAESIPVIDLNLRSLALAYSDQYALPHQNTGKVSLHHGAKYLIDAGRTDWAWQLLLLKESATPDQL